MEKGAGDANVSVGRGYGFQRWAQGGLLALFGGQKNGAVGAPKPGILRDGKKSRAAQRVTWPTVFVREDKDAQAALLDGTESDPAATPLSGMRAYGEILRLPTLAYELILIPLRVAYPELFIDDLVAIFFDVLFDLWGVFTYWLIMSRGASAGAELALSSPSALDPARDKYLLAKRVLSEAIVILPHHLGRLFFAWIGRKELFYVVQLARCERVRELLSYLKKVNNDLASNARILAIGKFFMILFCIPHWLACVWMIVADGWHFSNQKEVQLPSWPAQFAYATGNPYLDANLISKGERYLYSLYMAYAGLSGLGYPDVLLTHEIEMILSTVVSLMHTVFYAYVLGTLFHYLVRQDENTVNFRALVKACDEFASERKLPPAIAAKVDDHYRFQNAKSSSSTEKIFGQLTRALQTEVAVEQYQRELESTWAFFGATPQFLNAIAIQLRERFLPPRQVLFRRGDGALELSWCVSGMLTVTGKDGLAFPSIRADLGPGQIVGEVAFFLGISQPYTVSASTTSEVMLTFLTSSAFEEITATYPEQTDSVARVILRKYGLEKNGSDHPNAALALADGSRDRDEQEDFEMLRDTVRRVIVERNEERLSQVEAAVVAGDLEAIRTLIDRGLDPNITSYDGRTPLHLAAAEGSVQIINLLLGLDADMGAKDRWGATPLDAAVDRKQAAVAALLKARGMSLTLLQPVARLHGAVRLGNMDEISLLLSLDVGVSVPDHDMRTALHIAAAAGNDGVANFLISSLADVGAEDRWGCTPLDEAMRMQRTLVIQLLIRSAARPDKRRLAPLIRAAAKRADVDSVQRMLDMGVTIVDACVAMPHYDGRTGLHYAAVSGSISTVYLLTAALMDVNMHDRWGRTPLIDALETNPQLAALLAHLGAKLPDKFKANTAISDKLHSALALDMYEIMQEVGRRMQKRKDSLARRTMVSRELEIALKTSATMLHRLVRDRNALAHALHGTADRWISTYAAEESDTDSGASESDDASDSDSEDGANRAHSAMTPAERQSRTATAAKRFVRVSLQLSRAEEGLVALGTLFTQRMAESPEIYADAAAAPAEASFAGVGASYGGSYSALAEERMWRDAEHGALLSLLVEDLDLSKSEANTTLEQVYAQLAQVLGSDPTAPRGMGMAVQMASGADSSPDTEAGVGGRSGGQARTRAGSGFAGGGRANAHAASSARRQSGVGALFEVGKLARRPSTDRHVAEGDTEEATRSGVGMQFGAARLTTTPVYISDLGFSVLFTSRAFVRALALRDAIFSSEAQQPGDALGGAPDLRPPTQLARGGTVRMRWSRAAGLDAPPRQQGGDDPLANPSSAVSRMLSLYKMRKERASSRDGEQRQSIAPLSLRASQAPGFSRKASESLLTPSSPAAPPNSLLAADAVSRARRSVQRTAAIFTQLLAVFDTGDSSQSGRGALARPKVRLSDVRRLRVQLGESGSQQITAFYEHLVHAAVALGERTPAEQEPQRAELDERSASSKPAREVAARRLDAGGVGGAAHARAEPTGGGSEDGQVPPLASASGGGQKSAASLDSQLSQVDGAAARGSMHAADAPLDNTGSSLALVLPTPPMSSRMLRRSFQPTASAKLLPEPAALRKKSISLGSARLGVQLSPKCKLSRAAAPRATSALLGSARSSSSRLSRGSRSVGSSPSSRSRFVHAAEIGGGTGAGGARAREPALFRKAKKALLSEAQFYPAVAAWVFTSTADADADAAERAPHGDAEGGAAAAAKLFPKLNLLGDKSAGAAATAPASEDVARSPGAAAAASAVEKRALPAITAAGIESLDAALWSSAEVLSGIADRLQQRLDSARLRRNELVRAPALLAIITQTVAIPADSTAHMLSTVFHDRLHVNLIDASSNGAFGSTEPTEAMLGHAALLRNPPPTWASLEQTLRDAVATGTADGTWQAVGARSGARAADAEPASNAGVLHDTGALSEKPWYLVSVKSRAYINAHRLFVATALLDMLMMPTVIVFIRLTDGMIWLKVLLICIDAFYQLRIASLFFTTFVNDKSVEVIEPRACRSHYLATNCFLDVLGAMPLNLIVFAVGATSFQFYLSRLPRYLNARYVYKMHRQWVNSIDDEDFMTGIFSTMLTFLLSLHVLTTIMEFFGYSDVVVENTYETWQELYFIKRGAVGASPLSYYSPEIEILEHYLLSYFESVQLITATGGLMPANVAEFGFHIFAMLMTMTVYAVIVGQLSSIVMKQDDDIVAKRAQLELVQGYVKYIRVPITLKQRLTSYFQKRFTSTSLSSVSVETVFKGLPMELQIEVSTHTNRAVIEAAAILRGCSPGFVDRLSSLLQERSPEAGSVLFRTADACKELIFVAAGAIELYDDPPPDEEPVAFETASFGETLGDVPFVFNVRHVHNARTAADIETSMFVLPSAAYVELLKTFPGVHDTIMENAIHKHESSSTNRSSGVRSAHSGASKRTASSAVESVYQPSQSQAGSFGAGSMAGSMQGGSSHHHSQAATESANRLHAILTSAKKRRAELLHIRLCFACVNGEVSKVRALLNGPATDVNSSDSLGRRALHLAACSGSVELIDLLVASRADINAADVRGSTALVDAQDAGHKVAAKRLIQLGGTRGSLDLSARLCEAAADQRGGAEQLRKFILHGCNIDSATAEGRVALHVAAASGHADNVRVLIEGGASVSVLDGNGLSPLDEAVRAHHDSCAELLLAHGGQLSSIDAAMSLNQAVSDGDVQHLTRLVRFRCEVNARDDFDRTPLHLSASCGRVSAMQFLLEQGGINASPEDMYGATPLDDAARYEVDSATKPLSALLMSVGAKRGSGKDRTGAQPFRNAGREETDLEVDAKLLHQIEELLTESVRLGEWVTEQCAEVRAMRTLIDDALRMEKKLGPVLVEERPDLWSKIADFAQRQRDQYEHLAHEIHPMLERWLELAHGQTREPVLVLRTGVSSLLAHHDAGRDGNRDHVARLAEVRFRCPESTLTAADSQASATQLAAAATMRSKVLI